jgi:hypothetical protein
MKPLGLSDNQEEIRSLALIVCERNQIRHTTCPFSITAGCALRKVLDRRSQCRILWMGERVRNISYVPESQKRS